VTTPGQLLSGLRESLLALGEDKVMNSRMLEVLTHDGKRTRCDPVCEGQLYWAAIAGAMHTVDASMMITLDAEE
jgi:hypothetical protein